MLEWMLYLERTRFVSDYKLISHFGLVLQVDNIDLFKSRNYSC